MASLSSLPNEILMAIIEHLIPSPAAYIENIRYTSSAESRCDFEQLDTSAPAWFEGTEYTLDGTATNIKDVSCSRYSNLWTLRRTSRKLNNLCIPYLFHDLNLLDRVTDVNTVKLVSLYTSHVRSIRFLLESSESKGSEFAGIHGEISNLISQCHQATSLALYYDEFSSLISQLSQSILDLIRIGNIRSFRISANKILRRVSGRSSWRRRLAQTINKHMIGQTQEEEKEEIDMTVEKISTDIHSHLQPLIVDLTVERAYRVALCRDWEPFRTIQWGRHGSSSLPILRCSPEEQNNQIRQIIYYFRMEFNISL
ncbi:hypothetical protein CPB86DRAFT_825009 [Serendipita vermifera]|nr:hypothetical protein CPB86DRAFT_825009 [Serendipita vermifera]